ncbi:MAG: CoA-transferase [Nitrososphaerales archaeon]|jgi:acyl CoA:acetate/3-ketoacid CoA transferase
MGAPSKFREPGEALASIQDGSTVAVSGFNMAATPEHLILELYERYRREGHPRDLFMMGSTLPALPGRALDAVAEKLWVEEGQRFLRGIMMPYLGFAPWLQRLVEGDRLEAYSWPIGVTECWFRAMASGMPGAITKVGIDTTLDPRKEGGSLNAKGAGKMTCGVDLVEIRGEEHLLYRAPKPDCALVRASTSDEDGNLSTEDEGISGTVANMAQATKARPNPGVVLAQVRWLARSGTIHPRRVEVPSPLVDFVVLAPGEHHWQTGASEYDPRLSYRVLPPLGSGSLNDLLAAPRREHEKVMARRVLLEVIGLLRETGGRPVLVNVGVGVPALVSTVAEEEGVSEFVVTLLESGAWGGLALPGQNFGLAISPFALSSITDTFSNFEGGVIDAASLGFLQIDSRGNVNPSVLPGRIYGPGGFPEIAGGGPSVCFAGSFTAGRSDIRVEEDGLRIVEDGRTVKFVDEVYRSLFSGREAMKRGQKITYVTERAVFGLAEGGLVLQEVAPGVDVERDVFGRMEFRPRVAPGLKEMDGALFRKGKVGMRGMIPWTP